MAEVDKLPISEIFLSIDGEGIFAGSLAVFIRLCGCNLNCSYCDTRYACENYEDAQYMEVNEIVSKAMKIGSGCNHFTITGGEPLIWGRKILDIIGEISARKKEKNLIFNIETNGAILIKPFLADNILITMDCKSPSSGQFEKMIGHNFDYLRETDVLKFVIANEDFEWLGKFLKFVRPKCNIFLSPVFGKCEPKEIVKWMKSMLPIPDMNDIVLRCRVQVQLHKIIWPSESRGV